MMFGSKCGATCLVVLVVMLIDADGNVGDGVGGMAVVLAVHSQVKGLTRKLQRPPGMPHLKRQRTLTLATTVR